MRGPDIRPLGQWSTEYYITQGHAHYEMGQLDSARESFKNALREMKKVEIYTRMEKDYLLSYIRTTHPDLVQKIPETMDLADINLDKIDPDLRNYYRLTAHPDWD